MKVTKQQLSISIEEVLCRPIITLNIPLLLPTPSKLFWRSPNVRNGKIYLHEMEKTYLINALRYCEIRERRGMEYLKQNASRPTKEWIRLFKREIERRNNGKKRTR